MIKSENFTRELNLITDEVLKMAVKSYLDERVPDHFWEDGASSSGKYHPQFSQGKGGLVRHTKAVVMFAEELLRMSSYMYMKDDYKDYVIMACICHDVAKYGVEEYDKTTYADHAKNASILVNRAWFDYFGIEAPEYLLSAIRSHMGQWTTDKEDRPFTNIDRCVHMADYMASRSFIDIPQIVDEYNEVVGGSTPRPARNY
jgi:HD superfamily phosphohydrolase YqeK